MALHFKRALPGSKELLKSQMAPVTQERVTIAFLSSDIARETAAQSLVEHKQISVPDYDPCGLRFFCYLSMATEYDIKSKIYSIWLGYNGVASCKCPDFEIRAGACKHIRTALIHIHQLCLDHNLAIPPIPIPKTEADTRLLQINIVTLEVLPAAGENITDPLGPLSMAAEAVQDFLSDEFINATSAPGDEAESDEELDSESNASEDGNEFDFVSILSFNLCLNHFMHFTESAAELSKVHCT